MGRTGGRKLYELVLVDDERFTVDVFAEVINYKELGFNLAGVFYDGRKALEYIKTHHVDAVITDILMPEFTGLDLLKGIRETNQDIEVIFSSAYADFEFASFGIDHKIFKYVLKPLTIATLTDTLTTLHSHLSSKELDSAQITFQNYLNPTLQKALYDFIYKSNAVTIEQLQEILYDSKLPYNLSSDYMTIIDLNLIELDSYLSKNDDFNSDTIIQAVKNLMCRGNHLICPLIYTFDSFKVLFVAKADSHDEFIKTLSEFEKSLTYDLSTILNLQIDISLSKIFVDIYDLANYNRIFSESSNIAEELVNMAAEKNNKLQITSKLESIINEHSTHQTFMETFAYSVYLQILRFADQKKIREFIYPDDITLPLELDKFNSPVQIQRLIECLPETIDNIAKLFLDENNTRNSTIQKAIDFLEKNYYLKISLTDVANHVYCNPTYLSRQFKSTVGLSFTNYLNKIRIAHSEKLLKETDDSVYAIAKTVGYESMGYFYKKFKEKNGCSPDSYRQKDI